MAQVELSPGSHTLSVPITMLPPGEAGQAYCYVSSDVAGTVIIATGTTSSFTSTGSAQSVSLQVTFPGGGGIFYPWVVVIENGLVVGAFSQTTTVVIGNVTVGQGTWS